MGAALTSQIAAGKTPQAAYERALAEAEAEYGHQQGYSGAINAKARGYVPVELPARFTLRKFQSLLEAYIDAQSAVEEARDEVGWSRELLSGAKGRTAAAQAKRRVADADRSFERARKAYAKVEAAVPASLRSFFAALSATYYDKYAAPLCVEVKGAEAKRYAYVSRKRGERLYVFFGYAPC